MANRQQIVTELSSISPFLAEMEFTNPFSVPKGYFNTLPQVICETIRDTDKILPEFENENPYQVPRDYFDQLSENILSTIKNTETPENEISIELEEIAPLINAISKVPVYQVPPGYFTQTHFIAPITKEKENTKIVPFTVAKKWIQYAAAAVVASILVTAAFLFTDKKNYLEFENQGQVDFSSELTKLKDEELETYLNSHEHIQNTIPEPILTEGQDIPDIENTSIQLLSDEELSHYLSENAESVIKATPSKNY